VGRTGVGVAAFGYRADGLAFTVEADNASDDEMLGLLLHDLRSDAPVRPDAPVYKLSRLGPTARGWAIEGPRVDRYITDSLSDAIARLLAGLNVATLDASPRSLHLHAAAAAKDGQAVLIAAARHSGKSTTVANLIARGWSFMTDETVAIDDPPFVRGVPRPLAVKPGGRQHIRMPIEFAWPEPSDDATGQYVPIGLSGVTICDRAPVSAVVLLRRSSDPRDEPLVERLHPADAVVGLMQEALDAGRYGTEAVVRLAELAASATNVRLIRGNPERTVDAIVEVVEGPRSAPRQVRRFAPSEAVDPAVVSLSVDGRAVVHHIETGAILALDEPATRVWEVIGGWAAHEDIDLNGPVVAPFVQQLRDHRLLASSDAVGR